MEFYLCIIIITLSIQRCHYVWKVHLRGMRQGDWILDLSCHDWRFVVAGAATNQTPFSPLIKMGQENTMGRHKKMFEIICSSFSYSWYHLWYFQSSTGMTTSRSSPNSLTHSQVTEEGGDDDHNTVIIWSRFWKAWSHILQCLKRSLPVKRSLLEFPSMTRIQEPTHRWSCNIKYGLEWKIMIGFRCVCDALRNHLRTLATRLKSSQSEGGKAHTGHDPW